MLKIIALALAFAASPVIAFEIKATDTCLPAAQLESETGAGVVMYQVNEATSACAIEAIKTSPRHVYLIASNSRVADLLSKLVTERYRVIAVGPGVTAKAVAEDVDAAIKTALTELEDESDDDDIDPMSISVHEIISALVRNFGWRLL
jgi:hypothetical protein